MTLREEYSDLIKEMQAKCLNKCFEFKTNEKPIYAKVKHVGVTWNIMTMKPIVVFMSDKILHYSKYANEWKYSDGKYTTRIGNCYLDAENIETEFNEKLKEISDAEFKQIIKNKRNPLNS